MHRPFEVVKRMEADARARFQDEIAGVHLANRDVDMMVLTRMVGGQVFRVENANEMADCFDSINRMEHSIIQVDSSTEHEELFFYFAGAAAILLLLGVISEAAILSQ